MQLNTLKTFMEYYVKTYFGQLQTCREVLIKLGLDIFYRKCVITGIDTISREAVKILCHSSVKESNPL